MRIPVQTPITRNIAASLTHAFMVGEQEGRIEARLGRGRVREFEPARLTNELLAKLDRDGYEIVPKADARPGEPIEIRLPDGSIHGYYRGGEAPKVGTVVMLTPEGERLVDAVAKGDFSRVSMGAYASLHELKERLVVPDIGSLFASYVERPLTPGELKDLLTPEDFTGPIKLERGEGLEAPKVYVGATPGMSPWILKEVVPGDVNVQPYSDRSGEFDHHVIANAKAVVTRTGSSDQRELTVRTTWLCIEEAVEYSVGQALSLALRQAREAAVAFIAATSPAPATDDEEAA